MIKLSCSFSSPIISLLLHFLVPFSWVLVLWTLRDKWDYEKFWVGVGKISDRRKKGLYLEVQLMWENLEYHLWEGYSVLEGLWWLNEVEEKRTYLFGGKANRGKGTSIFLYTFPQNWRDVYLYNCFVYAYVFKNTWLSRWVNVYICKVVFLRIMSYICWWYIWEIAYD